MNKIFYAAMAASVIVCACNRTPQQAKEDITYDGTTVIVADESPVLTKIKTETVAVKSYTSELQTVGTVKARPENFAEVGIPFDGRIVRSYAKLGSHVRAGQTLFEVSSPEFFEASKTYFQSLQASKLANAEYERKAALLEHGVVSRRELEEACAEAENARQEKESAESMLRVYGVNLSDLKMGQAMGIVAPVSGEVVKVDITSGSYVKADCDPMVTIADLSTVWVTAQVKEHFIGRVTDGGKAEVVIESRPDEVLAGTIINVGNLVDEQTRSIQVVISCDNKDLRLKHGMYVDVRFVSEPKESILVPATSVFQGDSCSYVYVCTEREHAYERRAVEVGEAIQGNTLIVIRKGLTAGETIISEGGLYLNS